MNQSVLEMDNIKPFRPYSRKELNSNRYNLFRSLRVGKVMINHSECNHKYFARANGRKEKDATDGVSVGNCSVCWKINRTPRRIKELAIKLVEDYNSLDQTAFEGCGSYETFVLESNFYTWLYSEFNPVKDESKNKV